MLFRSAFNLPFKMTDYDTPWLEADPVTVKPIVVSRTARYRDPNADAYWEYICNEGHVDETGIFVGTKEEHVDFVKTTGVAVPYHPVNDFMELANIVAGADMVLANQNFVYSLAMGLGKQAMLETWKGKPLQQNECFFPRTNIHYF